jgi:hypothetical protein
LALLHLPARPTYAPLHEYGGLVQRAIILVPTFPCDRGPGIAGRQWGETLAAYGEHTSKPVTPVDHPGEEMLRIMSVDH